MLSPHTSAAIAQTVFYAPIVPLCFYIVIRNWKYPPKMAWIPFMTFSLIRLAGGILVILQASDPTNIGLIITAIILLNVGVIPLMVSTLGLIRLVLRPIAKANPKPVMAAKIIRISFLVAVSLLIASGALLSDDSTVETSRALSKAGYLFFAVILLAIIGFLGFLYRRKNDLVPEDLIYLHGTMLGMPTLVVRTIYGLLYTFTSQDLFSTWNPLFGSPVAFTLMALLPEYITLLIYVYLGLHRIRHRPRDAEDADDKATPVQG